MNDDERRKVEEETANKIASFLYAEASRFHRAYIDADAAGDKEVAARMDNRASELRTQAGYIWRGDWRSPR